MIAVTLCKITKMKKVPSAPKHLLRLYVNRAVDSSNGSNKNATNELHSFYIRRLVALTTIKGDVNGETEILEVVERIKNNNITVDDFLKSLESYDSSENESSMKSRDLFSFSSSSSTEVDVWETNNNSFQLGNISRSNDSFVTAQNGNEIIMGKSEDSSCGTEPNEKVANNSHNTLLVAASCPVQENSSKDSQTTCCLPYLRESTIEDNSSQNSVDTVISEQGYSHQEIITTLTPLNSKRTVKNSDLDIGAIIEDSVNFIETKEEVISSKDCDVTDNENLSYPDSLDNVSSLEKIDICDNTEGVNSNVVVKNTFSSHLLPENSLKIMEKVDYSQNSNEADYNVIEVQIPSSPHLLNVMSEETNDDKNNSSEMFSDKYCSSLHKDAVKSFSSEKSTQSNFSKEELSDTVRYSVEKENLLDRNSYSSSFESDETFGVESNIKSHMLKIKEKLTMEYSMTNSSGLINATGSSSDDDDCSTPSSIYLTETIQPSAKSSHSREKVLNKTQKNKNKKVFGIRKNKFWKLPLSERIQTPLTSIESRPIKEGKDLINQFQPTESFYLDHNNDSFDPEIKGYVQPGCVLNYYPQIKRSNVARIHYQYTSYPGNNKEWIKTDISC